MMTKIYLIVVIVLITLFAAAASAAILPRLMNGESLNISAIGTSLTDADVNPPNWFAQTGAWLDSLYPGLVTLSNRAVAGSWSNSTGAYPGGFLQLNDVLTYDNPDAVFIEFAINDAATSTGVSLAQSKINLQLMINQIKSWSQHVDIIISTMNNCPPYAASRPNLAAYYQGYRDVAEANGLLLIDNYPNWVNLYITNPTLWGDYVQDGIHPTSEGAAAIILPEVQASLMSQVPEPSTLVLLALAGLSLAWLRLRK